MLYCLQAFSQVAFSIVIYLSPSSPKHCLKSDTPSMIDLFDSTLLSHINFHFVFFVDFRFLEDIILRLIGDLLFLIVSLSSVRLLFCLIVVVVLALWDCSC